MGVVLAELLMTRGGARVQDQTQRGKRKQNDDHASDTTAMGYVLL
jgi:hypothetical protein